MQGLHLRGGGGGGEGGLVLIVKRNRGGFSDPMVFIITDLLHLKESARLGTSGIGDGFGSVKLGV